MSQKSKPPIPELPEARDQAIPEVRTWRIKRPGLPEEVVVAHMAPMITPSGVLVFQIIRKEGDQLLLFVHRGFTPPYDFEEIVMAESKEVH